MSKLAEIRKRWYSGRVVDEREWPEATSQAMRDIEYLLKFIDDVCGETLAVRLLARE